MASDRYVLCEPHFGKQSRARRLNIDDVKNAIAKATRIEAYDGRDPTHGGTNWRVTGPSIDGKSIKVGVEAFEEDGQCVLVITLFK